MGKNIVVFSDGTGQDGGTRHNTNVYKLFNLILDRSARQISFYDPGLGTGFRKLTGNVMGRGFSKNVRQCYEFIFENYQAGDKIFLLGFSRGAATVRSLAGFIDLFGILPRSRTKLIDEAWKIYKIGNDEKRFPDRSGPERTRRSQQRPRCEAFSVSDLVPLPINLPSQPPNNSARAANSTGFSSEAS